MQLETTIKDPTYSALVSVVWQTSSVGMFSSPYYSQMEQLYESSSLTLTELENKNLDNWTKFEQFHFIPCWCI